MKRPFIGTVRRALLVPGTHRWNMWVRDTTAWLERHGILRGL